MIEKTIQIPDKPGWHWYRKTGMKWQPVLVQESTWGLVFMWCSHEISVKTSDGEWAEMSQPPSQ